MLRFGAIGALNTALDFIIYNYISKTLGITSGVELGLLGSIGFIAAIVQSYLWNHAWAFASNNVSSFQNAIRLVLVGGLGAVSFLAVVLGAKYQAPPSFYLMILIGFLISEIALWLLFGLSFQNKSVGKEVVAFLLVSIVGLLINSFIISITSHYIVVNYSETVGADSIKNVAKAAATLISLIWNFLGYKLFVFKK